jgi:glycosyltransferase involved in cell wall biosynthesis
MPIGNYDGVYPAAAPRWETLSALGIPDERKVLLCCGLIRRYKGYETAILATASLGPTYHLVIGGPVADSPYTKELAGLASSLPNVSLLDRALTEQEFADLHAAADCVLLPYHKITGSSALLAAGTFGRGMVTSDLPFFQEQFALEPQMGELFRAGDANGLRDAIERFFITPLTLRHAAARRYADRYAWSKVVEPVGQWIQTLGRPKSHLLGIIR